MRDNDTCMYFGCWGDKGHYLFTKDRSSRYNFMGVTTGFLDNLGKFNEQLPQGKIVVIRIGDQFTVLGWKDNSVDTRPGSHSQFIFSGVWDPATALEYAKTNFPDIFKRFKYEVVL